MKATGEYEKLKKSFLEDEHSHMPTGDYDDMYAFDGYEDFDWEEEEAEEDDDFLIDFDDEDEEDDLIENENNENQKPNTMKDYQSTNNLQAKTGQDKSDVNSRDLEKLFEEFFNELTEAEDEFHAEWKKYRDYLYDPDKDSFLYAFVEKHEFRKKHFCTMAVEKDGKIRLLIRRNDETQDCFDLGKFKLAHRNRELYIDDSKNETVITVIEDTDEYTVVYQGIRSKF